MNKTIAVIRGDGIGPEIVNEAIKVLDAVAVKHGHTFTYDEVDMGGVAIDKWGDPLPQAMLDKCLAADSVLLGAVGGPKWEGLPGPQRPEKGLLRLRAGMGLYSNLRPAKLWPQLADASPLKPSIVEKGIDFMVSDKTELSLQSILDNQNTNYGPLVNNIDVLITGKDALSLTSIDQLAADYGITLGTNSEGKETLSLDDRWMPKGGAEDTFTFTGKDGVNLTLQTVLTPQNDGDAEQHVFILNNANG